MDTQQKVIYLTFDDGPIPEVTEWVLRILKEHQLQATFFCVGDNIRKNPYVFEKILEGGHTAANHTFNHLRGWTTKNALYYENIERCHAEIMKFTHEPRHLSYFRPPYGQITHRQTRQLKQTYNIVMWDVLSRDYAPTVEQEVCLNNSIKLTEKGSIIVFHDSIKAQRNMKYTLPAYIQHYADQGYTFLPLP
ncbi:polysaccharide deacetylase family protein [Algivirga pacifica]|uniref:Polysaccharide deacetylase family protein n=2 Tax=Algivirga pacifica TaxID=1162670 RepID=A0ABP9DN59_9BACT